MFDIWEEVLLRAGVLWFCLLMQPIAVRKRLFGGDLLFTITSHLVSKPSTDVPKVAGG